MDPAKEEENAMKIRLNFAIKNSNKSFYYSVRFEFIEEEKTLFETEQIKSKEEGSLIEFKSRFSCYYYFYRMQKIKIMVKKVKLGKENFLKNYPIEEKGLDLSALIFSKNGLFQIAIDQSYNPYNKNFKEILMIKVENNIDIDNNISMNKHTFIDYIISGIKFKCYIAIDFSDKNYQEMNPLKNQYLLSILGFRETLFNIVRSFEVYGFSYNLKKKDINDNKDFININKENEELFGYTQISYAYYQFLLRLELSDKFIKIEKKKKLSPFIYYLLKTICEKKKSNDYNIVFLLINSLNEEQYQDCIDCFFKTSFLPISFIIIGIGENESQFRNLKKLCEVNKNEKGIKRLRNNTFFISMKECQYKSDIIKNQCLKKIPGQICEFYERNKISLNDIKEWNIDNRNSIKIFDTYNSLIQELDLMEKNDNPAPSSSEININNNQNNLINEEEEEKEIDISPNNSDNIDINIDINNNNNKNTKKNNFPHNKSTKFSVFKTKNPISEKEERNKIKNNGKP